MHMCTSLLLVQVELHVHACMHASLPVAQVELRTHVRRPAARAARSPLPASSQATKPQRLGTAVLFEDSPKKYMLQKFNLEISEARVYLTLSLSLYEIFSAFKTAT